MLANKIKKKLQKIFVKKIAVPYPILYGELLKGKCAFITGGSSGIGYSIAEAILNNLGSVIIVGRNKEKLESAKNKLANSIKKADQFIETLQLDISDTQNLENTINSYLNSVNFKVDILVNNAGILIGDDIGKTRVEDYELLMKTNLEGTYFISQAFYNYFKKNKINGNILNVTSSSANRPANKPYVVSKQGEKALTLGMAKKFIKDGIVVNAVAPGPTATSMLIKNKDDGIGLDNNPSKRYTLPEEIANIAIILISDLGRMIVGDTVYVSGGAAVITYDDISY